MIRRPRVLAATVALVAGASRVSSQSTPPTGTLVVSNMNDNTATVLDAKTGEIRATLPTGTGPHEVAISRDGNWAVVSNYGARGTAGNSLTVISVVRAAVDRTIVLDGYLRPHGMVFLPGDSVIAVTCETRGAILLVNFKSGAVITTLATGGRAPHIVAATADGVHLYTGNIGSGTVAELDPTAHDSARVIRVGRQPEGITVAPNGESVWAGSNVDSVVVVVTLYPAQSVDTLRGFGLPYRIAITRDSRTAVITDPIRAEVRIVDAVRHTTRFTIAIPRDSLVATAEVPGSPSPEGVTTSADSKWAYVTLQGRNRVITIDLERGVIVNSAVIGNWSDGIGYSPVRGGRLM